MAKKILESIKMPQFQGFFEAQGHFNQERGGPIGRSLQLQHFGRLPDESVDLDEKVRFAVCVGFFDVCPFLAKMATP